MSYDRKEIENKNIPTNGDRFNKIKEMFLEVKEDVRVGWLEELTLHSDSFKNYQINQEALKEIKKFLSKKTNIKDVKDEENEQVSFNQFYDKIIEILSQLNEKDIQSIIDGKETSTAREFRSLFSFLDKIGISDVHDARINFWSGAEAAMKTESKDVTSSQLVNVPAYNLITGLAGTVKLLDPENLITALFYKAISGVWATHAKGDVELVLSSDKASENAGLTVGNFFYEIECPIIQRLLKEKIVTSIKVRLLKGDEFSEPFDFNGSEADKLIRMVRREAYLPNNPNDSFKLRDNALERFMSNGMTDESVSFWKQTKARPFITRGKLREFLNKWKEYKREDGTQIKISR